MWPDVRSDVVSERIGFFLCDMAKGLPAATHSIQTSTISFRALMSASVKSEAIRDDEGRPF